MSSVAVIAGSMVGLLIFLARNGVDVLPAVFLLGVVGMFYLADKSRSSGKSFITVDAEISESNSIDFDDIGGQDVAKNELKEALDFIKDTQSIKRLGIRPIKGILLSGPPGTGKTLLAKAAARYTNSVFLAASGSEFVEMYVGVGAKRIRQIFQQAKTKAKHEQKNSAVIFLDEIDVLGAKRGHSAGNVEYDQTLNELLVQMDGLRADEEVRVLIIAATNRVDMLDSALLRPGRFDRQVKVDLPDKKGRLSILELHARNKPLAQDVNLDELANDSFGFSGAHIENLLNEAAIMAFRDNSEVITMSHLKTAIDKVILGEKLDRLPNIEEKRRVAVHEAGHALVSELLDPGSVAAVHVASRSNALGYVRPTQKDDIYLYTAPYIKSRISVALAGFAAEKIYFGDSSTGASNDFKQASQMAKQLIFGGMSKLGIVSPDDLPQQILHDTISELMQAIERQVIVILTNNKYILEKAAEILLENESLSGDEFRQLIMMEKAG